jgi:hypothetical protein
MAFDKHVRLQEIASLMDETYITLAAMRYIPETAIKRGPHKIVPPSLPANIERDPVVYELMKFLPYVDVDEIDGDETPWLYGGGFLDYRWEEMLRDNWDPLNADGRHMTPTLVALTSMGNKQSVLFYDVKDHTVHVFDIDFQLTYALDLKELAMPYERLGFYRPKEAEGYTPQYDASIALRRLLHLFKEAQLIPWGAQLGGFVAEKDIAIKKMLRHNGWPNNFNPDQFNADRIRYEAKPTGKKGAGWVESTIEMVETLEGSELGGLGLIKRTEEQIARLQKQLLTEADVDTRWTLDWNVKESTWYLQDHHRALAEAKRKIDRLCPGGICVEEDRILWEFHNIERAYVSDTEGLQRERENFSRCTDQDSMQRKRNYLTWMDQKHNWRTLAYEQCRAEMLAYCEKTGCQPLPSDSHCGRTPQNNEDLRSQIVKAQDLLNLIKEWEAQIPEEAAQAKSNAQSAILNVENGINLVQQRLDRQACVGLASDAASKSPFKESSFVGMSKVATL